MVSTATVVIIAVLALAAGLIAGALLWRSFGPQQGRNRDLGQRLEDTERRFSDYQNQVTDHFVETSRRVHELTRNYKEVHEYLANSAVNLTNPSIGREMRAAAQIHLKGAEAEDFAQAEPREAAEDPGRAETAQDADPNSPRESG